MSVFLKVRVSSMTIDMASAFVTDVLLYRLSIKLKDTFVRTKSADRTI